MRYAALLMMLIGLTACSSDDPSENYLVNEVQIMLRDAEGVTSYKGMSGEFMRLFIRKDVESTETVYLECTSSSDGMNAAVWERPGGEIYSTLLPASVFAVYNPNNHLIDYDRENAKLVATVPAVQSAKESVDSLDLLVAYDNEMSAKNALVLNFQHVFAKVNVSVAYAGYFVDIKPNVNGINVRSCGSKVEFDGQRMNTTGDIAMVSSSLSSSDSRFEAYLAPGVYGKGSDFVSLIIEDYKSSMEQTNCDILIECCKKLVVAMPAEMKFESGKEYSFVLVLSPEGATLQSTGTAIIK